MAALFLISAFAVSLILTSTSLIHSQPDGIQFLTGFGGAAAQSLTLNGGAAIQDDGIIRLTNDTSRLLGHAFYRYPLRFKRGPGSAVSSFSTDFAFSIVPEYPKLGGHGLAFVISPTTLSHGTLPSQFLGLFNNSVSNSSNIFAVEFDTVKDFEFRDINDNHVGVDINSLQSYAYATAAYVDGSGKKCGLNLTSGSTIQAWIDYDGPRKQLNVTISPSSTKPSSPIISARLDLSSVLKESMYVGFSASTGLLASSHYVFGWNFMMNGAAPSLDLSALPTLPHYFKKSIAFIVAAATSAALVALICVGVAIYLFRKIKNADVVEPWELEYGPRRFSYKDLKAATKGFSQKELLGFGGFGKVYRGTLPRSKAQVAVKRVSHESKQGIREFVAEIESIGRLRHRNLVQLQGWCRRRGDLMLVYDFMTNGSLDKRLFNDPVAPPLSWEQRFNVVKGVSMGLLYLHEEWEQMVIHRDVKASNVLLDGEMNGRLGDFGLAKLHEHGTSLGTTRVVGTLGYLAPELTRTGKATPSTDVFAFGALLLEVACGRRPVDPKALPEEMVLWDLVWEKWSAGNLMEVVDRRMIESGGGICRMEEVELVLTLGLMCSHPSPDKRPTMREVVRFLNGDGAAPPEIGKYRPVEEGSGIVTMDDFVHSYPSSSGNTGENVGPSLSISTEKAEVEAEADE